MKPIVLGPQQRQAIERRRKKTLDRRIYQRLTAVLAVAAGHSSEDVAHLLGVEGSQLNQWLGVFVDDGLEVLCTLSDGNASPCND